MSQALNEFWSHPEPYSSGLKFRAVCKDVIDGDTYTMLVDLGFYTYVSIRVRLRDVDTPELRGGTKAEKERATTAKYFVQDLILNKPVIINTFRDKKSFDRWIADVRYYVRTPSGKLESVDLGRTLLENNLIK